MFMGGDNGFNSLIMQPQIKSFEEVRGRKVVVDAPNTAFALILYKILLQNGLRRGDYVVNPLGAGPFRIAGMQEDKDNAAVILNLPFSIQAERAGLRNIGLAVKLTGPYLSTVGFTLRSWAPANSELMMRYIRGYVEGLRWALDPANKAEASKLLAERLKLPLDIATLSYEIATHPVDGFARDAAFDIEGLRSVLKLRAEIEGQWGGIPPPPEKYTDLSYYRRALESMAR
jgi:ABC-type nitrate/sulfonate/bicarbonate transport system substrate-binding protein